MSFYNKEKEKRDLETGRFQKGHLSHSTHGHTRTGKRTPIYTCWRNMMNRCYQTSSASFGRYGGRGIKVCEEWQSFEGFRADMEETRFPRATIERLDFDADYSPENCIWIIAELQQRNTSRNRFLTISGETRCISEWAIIRKIEPRVVFKRLKRGWTPEQALDLAPRKRWENCGSYKKTARKP